MLVVHHLEKSRSQRILWLLEELGVPYEIRHYARDPATGLAPASLKAVHPLGKSPVITDEGRTIAESGAIIEYLLETHGDGRLKPAAGTPDRQRFTYWMHYAEGSLMPLLVMTLIFNRIERAPWPVRPVAKAISGKVRKAYLDPTLAAHQAFVEGELTDRPWFAGDTFSAADIQMSFPIEAMLARAPANDPRPHCREFLGRIQARPAYQRALERGGPFEIGH